MAKPWFRFYPRIWNSDSELKACSFAAQGLLARMMQALREADPYGCFVGRNGEPIDIVALAVDFGKPAREVRKLLVELEERGVLKRDAAGRLYQKRVFIEGLEEERARETGSLGGNPLFLNPGDKGGLNPTVNLGVNHSLKVTRVGKRSELELDTDSLRSSALAFGEWPNEIPELRRLGLIFVAAFARCKDAAKAENHIAQYAGFLAQIRGRGLSIGQAWRACEDARDAAGGKPLWGAMVKVAMSFLPRPGSTRASSPIDDSMRHMGLGDEP